MAIQAIDVEPDVAITEGVPPSRGYRRIYFAELEPVCALVPVPLAGELRSAAAAHEQSRRAVHVGVYTFKFWPAPSQAGVLSAALAAVRS